MAFNIRTTLRAVLFSILTLAPLFIAAQPAHAETFAVTQSSFCAQIEAAANSLGQMIADGQKAYDNDKTARIEALAKTRIESDKTLAASRKAAEKTYADQYQTLTGLADTDAKKEAMAGFKKSITSAIAARRKATDAAVKTYRSGMDKIIMGRGASYGSALKEFSSGIGASFVAARAECAKNPALTAMPAHIAAAIADTRETYQKAIRELDMKAEVEADMLATARDSSMATAETIFKIAAEAAFGKIRAVFES